jgi:hypothetical protein
MSGFWRRYGTVRYCKMKDSKRRRIKTWKVVWCGEKNCRNLRWVVFTYFPFLCCGGRKSGFFLFALFILFFGLVLTSRRMIRQICSFSLSLLIRVGSLLFSRGNSMKNSASNHTSENTTYTTQSTSHHEILNDEQAPTYESKCLIEN